MLFPMKASARQSALATFVGLVGVGSTTLFSYEVHLNLASTILLQLLLVVIVAFSAGFWCATIVSVFANLTVTYFIVPPAFSFAIEDTQNWVALVVFEFTALVVSRLSARAQWAAEHAALREQEIERLYDFSRQLLSLDRHESPLPMIAKLIERSFGANAVGLLDLSTGQLALAGATDSDFEGHVLHSATGSAEQAVSTAIWIKTLQAAGKPKGRLVVQGSLITQVTFDALASLTAIALERAWSFENESRAEAERQTERLRSAVLDALAHEYKTPLTTIRTASSAFLAMSRHTRTEEQLVTLIDSETEKLAQLTTRLLQTSRLDSHEVRLRLEPVDVCDIVRDVLSNMGSQLQGRNVQTHGLEDRLELSADYHLMLMSLSQIVDNAAKYSDPESTITIRVEALKASLNISVHSVGPPIPSDQLERIFDRFYRSPELADRAVGTGLGLSVTRKIVEAHGGSVGVTPTLHGNTFYISLPYLSRIADLAAINELSTQS